MIIKNFDIINFYSKIHEKNIFFKLIFEDT